MKRKSVAGMVLMIALCLSPSLFSEEKASVKPNCCKGPVLCPSFPFYEDCEDCCYRMHVDLGLLYEEPYVKPYSLSTINKKGESKDSMQEYKDIIICMNYTLGVTASLGVMLEHDNWYAGLDFDWMNSYYTDNFNSKSGYPSFLSKEMTGSQLEAEAVINPAVATGPAQFFEIIYISKFDFFDIGILLSRGSYTSRCYSIEPYMGVYALWNYCYMQLKYYNDNQVSVADPTRGFGANSPAYGITMKQQSKWGVGPMFGFNGEYHIAGGLSLFSDNRIAVMYGEAQTHNTEQIVATVVNANFKTGGVDYKADLHCHYLYQVRSIIGIKVGKYCLEDNHYVAIKIGYDARYVHASQTQDFYLNGLYASLIWDF